MMRNEKSTEKEKIKDKRKIGRWDKEIMED